MANRTGWLLVFIAGSVFAGCGPEVTKEATDLPPSGPVSGLSIPQRPAEFELVTANYGPLTVYEGEFDAESSVRPWSSWWYPTKDTYLFESRGQRLSPLELYDSYVRKTRQLPGGAALFERERIYDPAAGSWEGLCNAWAIASLMSPEPRRMETIDGITFNVGDQKALLVKTYERVGGLRTYGQRNNGVHGTVFDDIYPDQFHRLIQAELFERGRPFMMDKDPGVAVWNTPIWKASVRTSRDLSDPYVMHVNTWLFGASPFVNYYDYVGTLAVVFEYTYDLYGIPQADGSFQVKYGAWTGESINYHPDFLTVLPEGSAQRSSRNSEIDAVVVDEILSRVRKGR
jgi:hypothetical protein